ncbi:RNI-like protein [Saccharata proteae CBS 121410]|uniref:RNI-like protein n=1 Tax=Saccharata proteae CBS 121410 TaxID=1314787 RepID=A0A9P4LZH7_9PEZI|nr:RNI-like protein [Saccharata proteae CBS 121410]
MPKPGRRRSFFGGAGLPKNPLTALTPIHHDGNALKERPTPNTLQKRRPSLDPSAHAAFATDPDEEPLSAVSSKAPSVNWGELGDLGLRARNIIIHGEVQTSSTLLRRKKEYLVLTETHIVRFKSLHKACETFSEINQSGRSGPPRHNSTPSAGSFQDYQSLHSETSTGDRNTGTSLRHVVAAYQLVDDRPYFAFEIACIDEETNHPYSMTLQFGSQDEMRAWLTSVRTAANRIRVLDDTRVVEREGDYDPRSFTMPGSTSSSSDDLTKVSTTVCFLAIGIHKVHLIPMVKSRQRSSSPSLATYTSDASFGILTLTSVRLSDSDDTFELTFRMPFQKPKVLLMASMAAPDIAVRLYHMEHFLRPEWDPRPYTFLVPESVRGEIVATSTVERIDETSLDRTLCAYCIAYNIPPENIRYRITYPSDDSPRFELLPPAGLRRVDYGALELMAVMRTLRYNESFGTLSFAGIRLDILNGLHDFHGLDHVCYQTKRGTPVPMTLEELGRSCILVQEIRALAITSKKLRRMDFTSCITRTPAEFVDEKSKDIGCGIVEALFPLCKYQITNVDWVSLNNIHLGETDLEYLVAAAAEKLCHFRALEMSRCGLNERKLSLVLDALRTQENTLEAIDVSGNPARLVPAIFEPQLSVFGYIRILHLCNIAHTAGPEPLLTAETLLSWRLQELYLSGVMLNRETVDAVTYYLGSPRSESLRELRLDHTGLTGRQIGSLMRSMTKTPGVARKLHLDISQNRIELFHDEFTLAIADGYAPEHLTITLVDYEDEALFGQLALALAANNTIKHLDITKVSLPNDASEQTCQALEKMFTDNKTLESLDMAGENSKLEIAKLGVGINRALTGLKRNTSLRVLHIQNQRLGLQGASTLADVLKANTSLVEIHCENNDIPLQGFTDLVNALHHNTTLQWLPIMTESRQEALRQTEVAIRSMRGETTSVNQPSKTSSVRNKLATKIGKATTEKPLQAQMTDQDVRAAVTLVEESWDKQAHRLELYLQRNRDMAEIFERPRSMGKLIEQAQLESTPTLEKEIILGESSSGAGESSYTTTPHTEQEDPFSNNDDSMLATLAKELDISMEDAQLLIDADAASSLEKWTSPQSPTTPRALVSTRGGNKSPQQSRK